MIPPAKGVPEALPVPGKVIQRPPKEVQVEAQKKVKPSPRVPSGVSNRGPDGDLDEEIRPSDPDPVSPNNSESFDSSGVPKGTQPMLNGVRVGLAA